MDDRSASRVVACLAFAPLWWASGVLGRAIGVFALDQTSVTYTPAEWFRVQLGVWSVVSLVALLLFAMGLYMAPPVSKRYSVRVHAIGPVVGALGISAIVVPPGTAWWLLAVAAGALAYGIVALGLRVGWWRRPARFGACERCGYPLHGLHGARCPECGFVNAGACDDGR